MCLREAPLKKLQGLFAHCPNGGGLNACQDGLGHLFFREELPSSNGHLLVSGVVLMMQSLFGQPQIEGT